MRHFLSINDFSKSDILNIFDIADKIKNGEEQGLLESKVLALLFEKPSTRTRVSFEAAMFLLNGHSIYLSTQTMQTSRGESYEDTAMVLSQYVDFIAARLYKQSDLLRISKASSIPVINALTDTEHPCQALSDLYTIREVKKEIRSQKIAFIGDIDTNTAHSLMLGATKLGATMNLVGPKAVKVNNDYLKTARKQGSVEVFDSIKEGLAGADIVYTDTFVSMGQERDAAKRRRLFSKYQLNKKALGYASKNVNVMHCLPAHRGEEITADVLDGKRSIIWKQAKNKMFVEAAIIAYLYSKNNYS